MPVHLDPVNSGSMHLTPCLDPIRGSPRQLFSVCLKLFRKSIIVNPKKYQENQRTLIHQEASEGQRRGLGLGLWRGAKQGKAVFFPFMDLYESIIWGNRCSKETLHGAHVAPLLYPSMSIFFSRLETLLDRVCSVVPWPQIFVPRNPIWRPVLAPSRKGILL